MANFTASGMGGPLQPSPPAPAQGAPMNMAVSAEKRSKLKSYMEGYKDAIESKTAEQLLPNISQMSAPAALPPMQPPMQQPMQPPMGQPPMMMNMGGAVDVFDPMFMSNLGSEIMDSNEDSIIQGFSNGGFTSNISVKEGDTIGGRDEKEERIYSGDPAIFGLETVTPDSGSDNNSGSNLAIDQLGNAALNFAENNSPLSAPLNFFPPEDDAMSLDLASSGDFQGSANFNPSYDNTFVNIDNATEELSNMGKFEKGLANIFGGMFGKARDDAGNITPLGYADLLAQTKSTAARNQELEDDRRKDQESAERKLAEEQRMKAMIAGMMPQTPKGPTIPNNPIIDFYPLPPDDFGPNPIAPSPTDYMSASVPSTRVPGFDVSKISPYPQFNMPTSPMLPPMIQPEFFKQLMANMKMPVATMQKGGNVSSLDNALDNFITTIT